MIALRRTPSLTGEPEIPARVSLRPGTVHRLGYYTTARLTAEGSAPVSIKVTGEIDLACADELAAALCATLDAYPQGMNLDLTSVSFFDCRGLGALLTARASAQRSGRHFTLGPHSPAVARLLDLTGTRSLLTAAH